MQQRQSHIAIKPRLLENSRTKVINFSTKKYSKGTYYQHMYVEYIEIYILWNPKLCLSKWSE